MHQIISVIAHQIIRVIANQIIWRGQEGGEREQDGGEAKVLHSKILISIIIGNHMKMLRFKFHQNRTINEEFDFFEAGKGTHLQISILINIGKHMEILHHKFQQNRTINEELDFYEKGRRMRGGEGDPYF